MSETKIYTLNDLQVAIENHYYTEVSVALSRAISYAIEGSNLSKDDRLTQKIVEIVRQAIIDHATPLESGKALEKTTTWLLAEFAKTLGSL